MAAVSKAIDRALEAPIVTSFTNVGYHARRKLFDWTPLDDYDLTGRVVAITGPTSGLGRAAALQLAGMGAHVILVARNRAKAQQVLDEIASHTGSGHASMALADLGDLDQVRSVAGAISGEHDRLDVLIHNAGALFGERRAAADGTELTMQVQVVAPFLLTGLLLNRLLTTGDSRVLTMSSGGMYATGLTVGGLEMDEASYKGTEQYARAKRAQVTLNEMWAERLGDRGVHFHAMHPGWADTPGVEAALPRFRAVVGPLLRTAEQGADTAVWLAADDGPPLATNGLFWLDRRPRPIHKLPRTRRTDTPERRRRLWDWVVARSGWEGAADLS